MFKLQEIEKKNLAKIKGGSTAALCRCVCTCGLGKETSDLKTYGDNGLNNIEPPK